MLFNSIEFGLFFIVVFACYWLMQRKLVLQNALLLACSYFFYSCWDWRFLFLLIFSTLLDYFSGILIERSSQKKTRLFWLWTSIGCNLGFLGLFKYYNFFVSSFQELFAAIGWQSSAWTLQIILPVGISFYTFHGLSYVIDVYKKRIFAERNFVDYGLFVSYFPLLVAGPIERATHLLPQLKQERKFDYQKSVDGVRQILWGLFKKIVIADNCAIYANEIFNNSESYSGSTLIMGALFFTFQIYGDFSGYSDIALGTSRLLGIELLKNFSFPYFSRDIAEFWRRWHISLSSWFKDYVYIPLGGSKGGKLTQIRNTFVVFLLSGFWHGANWTFVAWGFLNALYFMPLLLLNKNRNHIEIVAQNRFLPSLKDFFKIALTFSMTVFAWIFFRAESISHAFQYIGSIFKHTIFKIPDVRPTDLLLLLILFILIEWMGRKHNHALALVSIIKSTLFRWIFYLVILILLFIFGAKEQQFIYFQF